MTNREWLDRKDNKTLADMFCVSVAKDGAYCDSRCPFAKLCVGGANGFEIWLGNEVDKNER